MTVKELIEQLQTMPQDARVLHINYTWRRKNALSDAYVFKNLEGDVVLATEFVGLITSDKGV